MHSNDFNRELQEMCENRMPYSHGGGSFDINKDLYRYFHFVLLQSTGERFLPDVT